MQYSYRCGGYASSVDIKHFIALIRKCKEPTEISDLMFHELIDKIVVYEAEGVGKARTQKVDIYFNYVGQIDVAYTEEELAEIKAQEEQMEQERQEKAKAEIKAKKGNHYYHQRICAVCGSIYWPTHSQQKFCSDECKRINHNRKTTDFYHKKKKELELSTKPLETSPIPA